MLGVVYLYFSFVLPAFADNAEAAARTFFGFSQPRRLGIYLAIAAILLPLAGWLLFEDSTRLIITGIRKVSSRAYASRSFQVLFPLVTVVVFFSLRNEFLNYDGLALASKFARDIPVLGAHVTHDEMWELCIHSRFWYYTDLWWGWSVRLSYQVLSSLAGGVFVFILIRAFRILFRRDFLPVLLLFICGGYMQLFFGDVENYTLTAVLVTGYFLASFLYMKGRISIIIPSAILAAAVTFHLLCCFLAPSLLFLFYLSCRRGEKRAVAASVITGLSIVVLTLLFFDWYCLPLRELWYNSHAFGHGGHIRMMLTRPSLSYFTGLLNLSFLLAPAWILIIPLLIKKRIRGDYINIHLLIACGGMAVFFLGWRAALGVFEDWNLYAAVAIPVSFLIWRNLYAAVEEGRLDCSVMLPAWLFFLHSYTWIVSNHFFGEG